MVRARADLHTHSSYSDGTDSPTELVKLADELQLGGIALTDHDTTNGIKEFMTAEASEELIRVPGIELSTEHQGKQVHVLGYFVPLDSTSMEKKLEYLRNIRRERFPKMVDKLRGLGFEIEQSEVDTILQNTEAPGRPHLAILMKQLGLVESTREAFALYIGEGKPAYVKKARLSTSEAIQFLREEGAVPIIAHPLSSGFAKLREFLIEMKEFGVLGVEADYNYTPMKIAVNPESVRAAMKGLDLIATGGSDYHGGQWMGAFAEVTVPLEVIEELKEKVDAHKTEA